MEIGITEKRMLKSLIELYGTVRNKVILDYGCGKGKLLKILLTEPMPKTLYAVDSSQKFIENVETNFKDFITKKVLTTKLAKDPKELGDVKFDGIFCVDVLECISEKVMFVQDLFSLLKPRGGLIMAHHDFDTIIYNSSNHKLTRDLVHNFADGAPGNSIDGQMGRKLPGIFNQAGLKNFNFETMRMIETTFNPTDYGYLMALLIKEMAKGKCDVAVLDGWIADLQDKATKSEYYFAIDFVVMIKVKHE